MTITQWKTNPFEVGIWWKHLNVITITILNSLNYMSQVKLYGTKIIHILQTSW